MSNTKLTKVQKSDLRSMEAELLDRMGGWVTSGDGRVTVVWEPMFPGSRNLNVAWSIAARSEQKIRGKVGRYCAIVRLTSCESLPVEDGTDMYALAEVLALTEV